MHVNRMATMEGAMGRVEVSNDELRTVRDATRELGRLIESLENGDAEKFVLTKHGQMRAVIVSLDDFTTMRACQQVDSLPKAA
jgi:antitoxin (DNA-binding transcriptional repressor) of toxin-antitoxin stability system